MAFRWLPTDNFEANLTADVTIDKSETAAVTLICGQSRARGSSDRRSIRGSRRATRAGVAYDSRFVPSNPYISYASFCAKGAAGNNYCFSTGYVQQTVGPNLTMDWKLGPDAWR